MMVEQKMYVDVNRTYSDLYRKQVLGGVLYYIAAGEICEILYSCIYVLNLLSTHERVKFQEKRLSFEPMPFECQCLS